MKTDEQFDKEIANCRDIFVKKTCDYGTAWRIMRPSSVTDQIYIKANRIRGLEVNNQAMIDEGPRPEYIGLINYSVMGLIQLEKGFSDTADMDATTAENLYESFLRQAKDLMIRKNHDYGEAWRMMRIQSITDLILMKIYRIKQIEDNGGKTTVSEGISSGYFDIINYAVFALIKLTEKGQ